MQVEDVDCIGGCGVYGVCGGFVMIDDGGECER